MDNREVLNAMKNGNIPRGNIRNLCVARDDEIHEFDNILEYIGDGGASTKFINGEFGAGKSFFLKVIEEEAYSRNYVVSRITIGHDLPFNKIDLVYRQIVNSLRCRTGTSLNHIIDRWITSLKVDAQDETDSPSEQRELVEEELNNELMNTRDYSNSFATAIEKYYLAREDGDDNTANYAQAWLRGDQHIPFTQKKKFGVKGDVARENVFNFLEALCTFITTIGYTGLVILIDEAEFIMKLPQKRLRDVSYNYIRDIYDGCSNGRFNHVLFVFAGTPQFFENDDKGVHSYEALYSRIEDAIDTEYKDLRTPIITLEGFNKNNLEKLSDEIIKLHSEAYDWNTNKIQSIIGEYIDLNIENAGLTGGVVSPRDYIRKLISILDTVEQNQEKLNKTKKIRKLFEKEKQVTNDEEEGLYDDW